MRPTANIIQFKEFENAFVKIQNNKEDHSSDSEAAFVIPLKVDSPIESLGGTVLSLEQELVKRRKKSLQHKTKYCNTDFYIPTSNVAERFFSIAGYCYSDLLQSLLPANLEKQLFLNYN